MIFLFLSLPYTAPNPSLQAVCFHHSKQSAPLFCLEPSTAPDFISVWGQILALAYKAASPLSLLPVGPRVCDPCCSSCKPATPLLKGPLFLIFPLPQWSSPRDPRGPTPACLQPFAWLLSDLLHLEPQSTLLPLNTGWNAHVHLTLFLFFYILYKLPTMFTIRLPHTSAKSTKAGTFLYVLHWHSQRTWKTPGIHIATHSINNWILKEQKRSISRHRVG